MTQDPVEPISLPSTADDRAAGAPTLDARLAAALPKVCFYLLLAALGVRFLYLSQYAGSPFFWVPALDSLYHDLLAREIVAGKAGSEPFFRAPLYYYFLAGVYKLFGYSFWAARLVQALIGSGSCVLLYLLGLRVFRPTVALIAAATMALYGPLVFFDGELLTPVLELFLDLGFLLLTLRAVESGSPRDALAAGLVLGLSAIARPNILVAAPLAAFWLRPPTPTRPHAHTAGWRLALLLAAGACVAPGLVTARNYALSGDPVFIASQGGINLFLGNRPEADGYTPSTPTRYEFQGEYEDSVKLYGERAAEEALGRRLSASEAQRYWIGKVAQWWREDPGAALRLTWKKWVLAWTHREVRNNHAFEYIRAEFAPYLWLAPVGFWYAGPFGILGMLLAWRESRHARFLTGFVLLYVLSFVAFFVADRYRLPVVPVLLLFAAYAVTWLGERLRGPHRKGLVPALAGLAALGLFVGVEWYRTATPAAWALDEWSAGNRYKQLQRFPEAEERYRKALALQPDNADIWTNLGAVQFFADRPADAADSFRQALRLQPENSGNWQNLAVCELALGEREAARQHLREALRLDPANDRAREELQRLENREPR